MADHWKASISLLAAVEPGSQICYNGRNRHASEGGRRMADRVLVLDTTLRDGAQAEGVSFSLEDKIKLIRALDELGVDYIEAGNPASNPKDEELFQFARHGLRLKNACLTAFGSTCRVGARAAEDVGLQKLAGCGARAVSIFGKSSLFHVKEVLRAPAEENLRLIEESVGFLKAAGLQVLFDAEHFYDGYREDPEYAMESLAAARRGGADILVLCDTNGGTLPHELGEATRRVVGAMDCPVGVHCHNDAGLAVALSMEGVLSGADMVQGTINGYGERCGNANLCTLLPNLCLKMGKEALAPGAMARMAPTARLTSEIANLSMDEHSPYVGNSAFAHKGGMHIDGMLKNRRSFEHISPEQVGNKRRFLVSEMAGRGALISRLGALAPELSKGSKQTVRIMDHIKELEAKGYAFEAAGGSLELLVLGALGRRPRFFEVLDFHVVSRKPEDDKNAQAYVKVAVDGRIEITADEGDGPVNALDLALRKALRVFYPCLNMMRLKDFKVRVVSGAGTASVVRVHIDSTDGVHLWSTVGVSSNVIEASFIALSDSIEYMLLGESRGWAETGAQNGL